MADLPDWTTTVVEEEMTAGSFTGGADAAKPAAPVSKDIYLATDTKILYVCIADGAWTGWDASMIVQGVLTLYADCDANGKKITDLALPVADTDAASKAYVLSALLNITISTYTGNGGDDVAVAHGLGVVPKLVLILRPSSEASIGISTGTWLQNFILNTGYNSTVWDDTNFYVEETDTWLNANGVTYNFIAFG